MKKNAAKPPPPRPTHVRSTARLWGLAALCLFAAAGTWAVLEFVVWNRLPGQLVGRWEVASGPPEYKDAVFEFHRSGKMIGHLNVREELRIINADIRVEGDKIFSTTRHPRTGKEITTSQTVRVLTDRQLVIEDQAGNRLTMTRAD